MMKNINVPVQLMMYLHDLWSIKIKIWKEKLILNWLFISDEHELDDCKVDEETRKILLNNIRRRLTPQAVKCRAGR
jgi:hypothetical protein